MILGLIILGVANYFQVVEMETTLFGGIALAAMLAVAITRRRS